MDLSELLLEEAIKFDLCQPWINKWQSDMDSLADMYKRGMDFCVKHDYPSLDILRRYLKGKTEDYNIFIDTDTETTVHSDTVVVLGDSKLRLWVSDYGVVNLYALHDTEITLFCGMHSVVSIETYNSSKIKIQSPSAKVSVFQYDGSSVESKDAIKIFKRERDAT